MIANLTIYKQIEKQFFILETLYAKIGPENLKSIVFDFYNIIFDESKISHLFKAPKEEIRDKQLKFLTQFLGGPQLYSEQYGHPRMRARHLPHKIDESAAFEWLKCMKKAIQRSELSDDLKQALYNCFPQLAMHMINR